ncbi:MAG: DUF397 domain-containing protein [Pseudonocardiaceae bacterium]
MSTTGTSSAIWRKSSRSNGQMNCVEVTDLDGGARAVRDSKDSTGPALIVTATGWSAFTASLRTGTLG